MAERNHERTLQLFGRGYSLIGNRMSKSLIEIIFLSVPRPPAHQQTSMNFAITFYSARSLRHRNWIEFWSLRAHFAQCLGLLLSHTGAPHARDSREEGDKLFKFLGLCVFWRGVRLCFPLPQNKAALFSNVSVYVCVGNSYD